jgi:transposase
MEFLKQLRREHPEQRMVIFLDNLRVYKTRAVKEMYEKLGLQTIFNPQKT